MEHEINADLIFYTLYGHLSPISKDLKVGQTVKKGEQIATIGTFPQNGNWAEHLHFQVILDMLMLPLKKVNSLQSRKIRQIVAQVQEINTILYILQMLGYRPSILQQ